MGDPHQNRNTYDRLQPAVWSREKKQKEEQQKERTT